ncbi:hypothetical protein F0L17_03195 [Streptomyces sp. TRM43335]|uniref:AG1 protein n=1 Tax=Streptomyces taklimakanensis TaxID=2569853 RepID=A0A6G2B7B5_9ACTN|nr:hypothetical protein [Streptomyces taklimakanensis]MTE18151.1 hypothetical protein [Streptomyces taklimakanensis]
MTFDEEWNQLVTAAAERKATSMRLNRLDGGGGGGVSTSSGELAVTQKDLAAVGDAAFDLHERLRKDGDHARESSTRAAAGLKGDFEIGDALDHVATRWQEQLRTLTDACAHISNHMEYSNSAHANDEQHIGSLFNSVSALDEGFDERTRLA